jgi:hypothetical protein
MAEKYQIEQVVSVITNDNELYAKLITETGDSLSTRQKQKLANLLIDNNSILSSNTVEFLYENNILKNDINAIVSLTNTLYKQILYTYKYSAVKIFFRENYAKFLPPYDVIKLQNTAKKQIFAEAFMREFDRFSKIIDDIYNIVDIDKIPLEYLDYLAQIIGYERQDYLLLTDVTFRELLKNIIEIYRIKGTNYSFELFFGFLGFDITLREFWFDKRLADPGITSNSYTSVTNKWNMLFYLTPLKPTDYIPSDMEQPYSVNEDEITTTLNINMLQKYLDWKVAGDTRGYHYKELIGDTEGFSGDSYTFFKTNIIQYNLESLVSDDEIELSNSDLETIALYVSFLTPIFVSSRVLLAATPLSDSARYFLGFSDSDRSDPIFIRGKSFAITSIDAVAGDSGDTYSVVKVSDPGGVLFNHYLHRKDYIFIGDSNTSPVIGSNDNIGYYFVAGDTEGDSYAFYFNGVTTIKLDKKMAADQSSTGGYFFIGKEDAMLHLYEGTYPGNYYWGDTILGDSWEMNYDEANIPGRYEYFNLSWDLNSSRGREPQIGQAHKNISKLNWYHGDSLIEENKFINPYSKTWIDGNETREFGTVGFWKGDTYSRNLIPYSFRYIGDSWSTHNASYSNSEYYIGNYNLIKIEDEYPSTSFSFIRKEFSVPSGTTNITIQTIFKKGTSSTAGITITTGSSTYGIVKINFSNETVSLEDGDTISYKWLDDETVWIALTTEFSDSSLLVALDAKTEATASTIYTYVGAVKLNANIYPVPFDCEDYSRLTFGDSNISGDTFFWPSTGSIEAYIYPRFNFDDDKNHIIFSDGTSGGNWNFRLYYNQSSNRFTLQGSDDGGSTSDLISFGKDNNYQYSTTNQFASNSVFNDWHWIKIAWDSPEKRYKVWIGGSNGSEGDTLQYIGQMTVSSIGDSLSFNNSLSIGYDPYLGDSSIFEGEITDFILFKEEYTNTSHFYDNFPYLTKDGKDGGNPIKGGHFVSGFHTDTRRVVYDRNYKNSAYNVVKNDNSNCCDEQIIEEINNLAGTGTLYSSFSKYRVRERDLLILVDTIRNNTPGDSVFGAGDTFTKVSVGDSILYFGDSHVFVKNTYTKISGSEYLITDIGDTYIKVYPFIGDSGIAYPLVNYFQYYSINDGDSIGDSAYTRNNGFLNSLHTVSMDLNETSNITLGSNLPLNVNFEGRPFENQSEFSKDRKTYYDVNYTSVSTDFVLDEIVSGTATTSAEVVVSAFGGDSMFHSLSKKSNFIVGTDNLSGSEGGEADLVSITERRDDRGKIIKVTTGNIYVYDPIIGDSATTTEFSDLTSDSYLTAFSIGEESSTEKLIKVNSSSRVTSNGDTVRITTSSGLLEIGDTDWYVSSNKRSIIKNLYKVGSGDSVGVITLYDVTGKYMYLKEGDTFEIYGRGDTNDGFYTLIEDSSSSVGITTIRIGDSFPGSDGINGFIRSRIDYWEIGDSHFPFDFDYIEIIKMRSS